MTDAPPDLTTSSSERTASWRRLALLLAAALVVAVAGLVVLWVDRDDDAGSTDGAGASAPATLLAAGSDAEEAARAAVVRMTSYGYRTVDADFAWVEEVGTDKFERYFAGASDGVKKVITETRATASGEVVASAPHVVDATHVTVLLFVDQTIEAAGEDGPKVDQPRVTMKMVEQGGRWLVDEVSIEQLLG